MRTLPRRWIGAGILGALLASIDVSGAPALLQNAELKEALVLGQTCRAPIVHIVDSRGDIGVYVESPFARAALLAANATEMHQPIDSPGLTQRLRPGYRIWLYPERVGINQPSVLKLRVRHSGRAFVPRAIVNEQLWVGRAPSHGIVDALRWRYPEFTFDSLPEAYEIVVDTDSGTRRYRVHAEPQSEPMRVCNRS